MISVPLHFSLPFASSPVILRRSPTVLRLITPLSRSCSADWMLNPSQEITHQHLLETTRRLRLKGHYRATCTAWILYNCSLMSRPVARTNWPRRGFRFVATGGAQRNPWRSASEKLRPEGGGRRRASAPSVWPFGTKDSFEFLPTGSAALHPWLHSAAPAGQGTNIFATTELASVERSLVSYLAAK
jgi:hypothetical protein